MVRAAAIASQLVAPSSPVDVEVAGLEEGAADNGPLLTGRPTSPEAPRPEANEACSVPLATSSATHEEAGGPSVVRTITLTLTVVADDVPTTLPCASA